MFNKNIYPGLINWKNMKNVTQYLCTNDTHVLKEDDDFRSDQPAEETCFIKNCANLVIQRRTFAK